MIFRISARSENSLLHTSDGPRRGDNRQWGDTPVQSKVRA